MIIVLIIIINLLDGKTNRADCDLVSCLIQLPSEKCQSYLTGRRFPQKKNQIWRHLSAQINRRNIGSCLRVRLQPSLSRIYLSLGLEYNLRRDSESPTKALIFTMQQRP